MYAYTRGNVLYKGAAARALNDEEAEELMGYPPAHTATLRPGSRVVRPTLHCPAH